jgi:hypothetical protein
MAFKIFAIFVGSFAFQNDHFILLNLN